jgi:hypothetical protein
MYVNPQPLTFADLARATLRSAGLGQITTDPFGTYDSSDYVDYGSASSLPLSTPISGETNPSSPNYNPYTVQLAAAGSSAVASIPWGTIGLAAAGILLFGMLAGKR